MRSLCNFHPSIYPPQKGQKLAAYNQGLRHKDVDLRFRVHLDGLVQLSQRIVGSQATVSRAFIYGSPSTSDSVWQEARSFCFNVQM
jgi:hypothetical protein